jgi:hypothetical protein
MMLIGLTACSGLDEVTSPEAGADERVLSKGVAGGLLLPDRRAGLVRVYEVTITNLTSGQPFSPGVVATHSRRARLFRVGAFASEGIRLIAENGDPSVASDMLANQPGVHEVVATNQPIHRRGGPGPNSLTVRISASPRANFLSLALMLICTNDGFVGLNSVPLPFGFRSRTYFALGFDAGTEANDELYTSIVDACGAIGPVSVPADGRNDRTATHQVIKPHRGIHGVGDLDPAQHDWKGPVAKVTIRRLK